MNQETNGGSVFFSIKTILKEHGKGASVSREELVDCCKPYEFKQLGTNDFGRISAYYTNYRGGYKMVDLESIAERDNKLNALLNGHDVDALYAYLESVDL